VRPPELLIEARSLIDNREKWTQGEWARLPSGVVPLEIEQVRGESCAFCAIGAIWAAAELNGGQRVGPLTDAAADALRGAMGGGPITHFNDTRTYAEVIAAYDAAITALATESQERAA
jgi:hypothetical protein